VLTVGRERDELACLRRDAAKVPAVRAHQPDVSMIVVGLAVIPALLGRRGQAAVVAL